MELTDLRAKTLARLRRYPIWAKQGRGGGFVTLETVGRSGQFVQAALDEGALNELLKAGLVEASAQRRILEDPLRANPQPHVVSQTYWKAAQP